MDGKALAQKWEDWKKSPAGRSCLNAESLGLPPEKAEYLHNRLWHAFTDGASAGCVGSEGEDHA